MSVVNEYKDPMSGKVNHFAKGSIKFISIKPVKNADQDGVKRTHIPARNGQPAKVIEATHSISFLMQAVDENNNVIDPQGQGEWVGMGEKKLHASHTDKVQVKFDSGYKDILTGMVVSFPLKVSKNGDKTYINGTLSGKTFNILDESKAGQAAPRQQQSSAQAAQSGGGVKIFGEITEIVGNLATVNDEKNGPGGVVLSDEQLAQVSVGGRMTAFVDMSNGNILNGFKAYGPAGQNSGGSGAKGKRSNYDPVGVSAGHAMNALVNLKLSGFKGDVEAAGKIVHDVTTKLIKELSEAEGKDVGQTVGNAVKYAVTNIAVKGKTIDADELEKATREAYALAATFYSYASATAQEESQKPSQPIQERLTTPPAQEAPAMDFDEPPMDFDDDIPFAPIGLPYGRNFIHCI